MSARRSIPLVSRALALLAPIACGGQEDAAGVSAPDTATSAGAGPGPVDSEAFEAQIAAELNAPPRDVEEIIAMYPEGLPELSDGVLIDAKASRDGGAMQTITSEDDPDSAASFYRREYEGRGWQLDADKSLGGLHLMTFSNERGRKITVTTQAGEEGGSKISVILEK